jgi:hypothetical protein
VASLFPSLFSHLPNERRKKRKIRILEAAQIQRDINSLQGQFIARGSLLPHISGKFRESFAAWLMMTALPAGQGTRGGWTAPAHA